MMRLTIHKLLAALVVLLLFASCEQEEFGQEDNRRGDGEKIRFEVAVEAITATPSAKETRVATSTDGNYTTTWTNGDSIGVYIVKGDVGLQSDNWVNNMKVTYNDGVWTPEFPSGKEYFPTDGEKLHFYAYYPYDRDIAGATILYYLYRGYDQNNAAQLSASDMLYASTLNVSKGTPSVQLNFTHLLTMVELSVNGVDIRAQGRVDVSFKGYTDIGFRLSEGQAHKYDSNVRSVKMCRVEQPDDADYFTKYTYRVLVPTQTILEGTELFHISCKQGFVIRTLTHTVTSDVVLHPGQVKPYTITLQPSSTIDPNHVYAVGDYYPYKGFPIQGVVFEVRNGGRNGKIIDLNFINRYAPVPDNALAPLRWGDPTVDEHAAGVVDIRDWDDGYSATRNLIIKRKDQPDFANTYCVFNWIYLTKNNGNIDGMWYLPAVNELKKIQQLRSIINLKIEIAGGSKIESILLSSNEESASHPLFVNIYEVAEPALNKADSHWSYSYAVAVGQF